MNDRDYFAAAALTGLLHRNYLTLDEVGPRAWQYADAMLAARGPVAETPEPQHVAGTCRSERQDAAPPQPPAAGVTLTDAEREALALADVLLFARWPGTVATLRSLLTRLG